MRSTILVLASLLTFSFALPQSNQRRQSGTEFLITDYNPGCGDSPEGCLYSFDLSITPQNIQTSCDGTDVQGDSFGSCTVSNVTSHEVAQNGGFFTLFVNYTFSVGDELFKDLGSVNVTDLETDGQSFTIVPTTVSA